jgi:two-component system chemotaxis response regulator CheY
MKKVLITDDASFMRMMLRNILEKNGYEVIGEAVNGADAIEKYRILQPDFVTMDITMPEMNGIDAVKGIKAVNAQAKIIMVSAMGQQELIMDALKAGAKDFIVKPFNETRILESFAKLN